MKIFGIGLGRTGTKSIAAAMWYLGYKVKHGGQLNEIWKYDFVNDIAVSVRYKFLDYCYPGSKFILTIRDVDSWIASSTRHAKGRGGQVTETGINIPLDRAEHRWLAYGITYYDEEIFRVKFKQHNDSVLEYFKNRKNDLLVHDLCGGDEWEKLCEFLGKDIPKTPFPHRNKSNK